MVLYCRPGQTCSKEESFAENQKQQRTAKSVCSVSKIKYRMIYKDLNATHALFAKIGFLFHLLLPSLQKSGQYAVKAMRINSQMFIC